MNKPKEQRMPKEVRARVTALVAERRRLMAASGQARDAVRAITSGRQKLRRELNQLQALYDITDRTLYRIAGGLGR